MKKKILGIIVGATFVLNIATAGVPVGDKVQIGNGIKQLLEYVQQHSEQVKTWKDEASRYVNEITGIDAGKVLENMGISTDGVVDFFLDKDSNVYKLFGKNSLDGLLGSVAKAGFSAFPPDIKNAVQNNYGSPIATPKSIGDLALNKAIEYCKTRDAYDELLKKYDGEANKDLGKNLDKTVNQIKEKIGVGESKGDSYDQKGTTTTAAGTTATAVASTNLSNANNNTVKMTKDTLIKEAQRYDLMCKEATAQLSNNMSTDGFGIIIDVLTFGPSTDKTSFSGTASDPRFQ